MNRKKIGRNDPCPCGSGKKFKKCHGGGLPTIPAEVWQHVAQVQAEEASLRTQGIYINIVRPILFQGKKVWAIGNRVYLDRRPNETFHEFIIAVLRETLRREWWDEQLSLPAEQQHFIMQCFRWFSEWTRRHAIEANRAGDGVFAALPDGWGRSLLALAWDVSSLLHASSHIPDRLLDRLRSRDQYQGARYELSIAAIFARLGFTIEFLDEVVSGEKHCEFIATHPESRVSIAVEVKSRHREGVLHMEGEADPRKIAKGRGLLPLLNKALTQNPGDRPFVVFIDVNAPQTPGVPLAEKQWAKDVWRMMDQFDAPTPEDPDEWNALFFTNYSYHYQSERTAVPGEYLMVVPQHTRHELRDTTVIGGLKAALDHYGNVPNIEAS